MSPQAAWCCWPCSMWCLSSRRACPGMLRTGQKTPSSSNLTKVVTSWSFFFIKSSQVSFFLDCCKNFLQLSLSGLRTLFKKRPEGARRWILCFTAVFCMSKAIESGAGSVIYMFYRWQMLCILIILLISPVSNSPWSRIQYGVTNSDMSNLFTAYTWLTFFSQVQHFKCTLQCLTNTYHY